MAITYKWEIPAMNSHVSSEGQENVIYTVHYRYTGSKESNGEVYSSTNIGTQGYTYVAGDSFTPYENTEAFQNKVIGWLEGSLDVSSMQESIAADIESQITPVNEDLYFTWADQESPLEDGSEEESTSGEE